MDINPHRPTEAELKKFKLALPQIKKQLKKHRVEKGTHIAGVDDPQPCIICGTIFDRSKENLEKSRCCPSCRIELRNGMTALVCIDGRYAFLKADDDSQAQKLIGQIVPVKSETMDAIQQKMKEGNASKN